MNLERLVMVGDDVALRHYLVGGGDPNRVINGSPLLVLATGPKGGLAKVRMLLQAGADPNHSGGAPLQNAASWSNLEACKLLVSHGADPTLVDRHGRTSMDAARTCSHNDDVVAFLRSQTDE